ncbi:hypothetical protein M758_7G119600 [Ceratodon purpureus]|nr:hypothetical protein M758_7G119600 [Ceratodon purpureus]
MRESSVLPTFRAKTTTSPSHQISKKLSQYDRVNTHGDHLLNNQTRAPLKTALKNTKIRNPKKNQTTKYSVTQRRSSPPNSEMTQTRTHLQIPKSLPWAHPTQKHKLTPHSTKCTELPELQPNPRPQSHAPIHS